MAGTLYLCATPIGNLGDISERCLEILRTVDLIAAEDTRRTLQLLNHFNISRPLTSYHEHNKREKGEYIIKLLLEGKNIAQVSDAGTPAISDPGEDLVRLCAENNIAVTSVPGPVAAVTALILSGLPTSRYAFEGFLSVNKRHRNEHLESIKNDTHTLIFYEAPHKLKNTLADMLKYFGSERRIAIARELTKLHEEILRFTVGEAVEYYGETNPRGEYVLVVEGAPEAESTDGGDIWWSGLTIKEHVKAYIKDDSKESVKAAIKKTAEDRGLPRREVYGEYHK
ncbi:MAG TPA: 16S rRNA (cytidine(1402)-2'-O)-methyltransferase [Candidatus Ornithomonoglobus intestinigallinarum]|uniref:Ribosomal RNA small subunit methyltransferase I n=1 Tax=Candidatus Ornithomonoglobus intestinigallinarum TaxID=2840894 RepID=A0A9D1KQG3_9FIRM|nr:16S rRNA (cytidine(1402)-2'-O)-methyltransferase [Candidatus Ornithomonoglobus intestinigallinarum]